MRISETFRRIIKPEFLIAVLATLYCITPIHNGNIFWHLRNGLDILETGEIRTTDPFTWTRHGVSWIQHEWLAETAIAFSWQHFGEAGPVLLKALFIGLSVFFAAKASVRNGACPGFAFLFGAMWLALAQPRWIARPHFFSIFFFSLYLYILSLGMRKPWKFALVLLPLQILWVNVHAGFVMGIFLAAIPAMDCFFSGKFREFKTWVIPPVLLLLASGVHPNGFRTLEYLPAFLAQPLYKESIREWWSPFDPRYAPEKTVSRTAILFMSFTAVTVLLLCFFRKSLNRGKLAGLAILSAATVFAARNGELLAPAMLAWIPGMVKIRFSWKVILVPAVLLLIVPFTYGVPREIGPPRELGAGVDWNVYPVELADLLEANPCLLEKAVLFNTNEISGYLEYRFGEKLPLFVDGRCLLFPEGFHREYLVLAVASSDSYRKEQYELFKQYGFTLLVYNSWNNSSSVHMAAMLPEFRPIYIDGLAAAYASVNLLEECNAESLAFQYFDPLDPGVFLAKPLYLMPAGAAGEILEMKEHFSSQAMTDIAEGLIFRCDSNSVLQVGPPAGINGHTLLCWQSCREGNLETAAEHALLSGDSQLQTAVSFLQGNWPGADDFMFGFHGGIEQNTVNMRTARITALWITGQEQKALQLAEENLDSLSGWCISQVSVFQQLAGNEDKALELAGMALESNRGPVILQRVATVVSSQGDYGHAIEYCREALEIAPEYTGARLLLADCLWNQGDISDAADLYRYLLDRSTELPAYALNRLELVSIINE